MLRALYAYRGTWDRAQQHGVALSAEPQPPSFEALGRRYDDLLDGWCSENPGTAGAALAYTDLAQEIVAGELMGQTTREGTGPVTSERDLSYALQLLARVSCRLNEQALGDAVRELRTKPGRCGQRAAGELISQAATSRWCDHER